MYCKHNSTSYLSRSGRSDEKKKFNQQFQTLDNKTSVSRRRLAHRFGFSQLTISRHWKKRTSIRIYKRRSSPKYKNEDPQ